MNVENNREDWLLWQISDSALPTGGFVASSGLESAIQTGYVHDIPSLSIFLSSSIDNYAFSSLPFVTGSWNIGNTNNEDEEGEDEDDKDVILRKIMELDDLYDSCTSNHVAKRASKAQGVAMLILFSKSFNKGEGETAIVKDKENQKNSNNNDDNDNDNDNDDNDNDNNSRFNDKIVEDFKLNVRKELACGHLPVCFGLVTRYLGISLEKTQHLYLFLFARAIISAAVRLNIIGPYYSQRMLTECCQVYVENSLKKTCNIKVNDASQTSPLLDILQGRHDKLYSRLFNS